MLLQRVNLKGFLAHRGVQEAGALGFDLPVELDFRGSALWLIHGPNGSGKSSIFDAVTFALYDQARGRGRGFGEFINDRCDRAEVEVEIEIGENSYLIHRGVSRGKGGRGAGKNSGQVHRQTASGWQIESGTQGAIPAWTEKSLRLSYENFVCAAILRQGEADVFLKTLPSKRKEQLMKLLDLDVYKQLGEAANARKSQLKAVLTAQQTEFDACRAIGDEELEAARNGVEMTKVAWNKASDELNLQATKMRDAEQAAAWLEEIGEKEKQQGQNASILGEAARIEAHAKRHQLLGDALPRLEALWRVREILDTELENLGAAQEKFRQAEADRVALAPKLQAAREAETQARNAAALAQSHLINTKKDKTVLDRDLANLRRIEGIERKIVAAEADIAPFQEILSDAVSIEADFKVFGEFHIAGHKLRPLLKAEQKLAQVEAELSEAQGASAKAAEALTCAQERWNTCEKAVKQRDDVLEMARADAEGLSRRLHALNEKLGHREGLHHADNCPTCGSHLDEPETRARLEHERNLWQRQARELNDEIQALNSIRKNGAMDKEQADAEFKSAQWEFQRAHSLDASAKTTAAKAFKDQVEAKREHDDAWSEAGAYAGRIDEYETICADYKRLQRAGTEARHQKLVEARAQTIEAQTSIGIHQDQLRDELPIWSSAQRQELRDREIEIQSQLISAQDADALARKTAEDATQLRKKLEVQTEKLSRSAEIETKGCKDATNRVHGATKKVEAELVALPRLWKEHAAANDSEELSVLKSEFLTLTKAPERAEQLRSAREWVSVLNGQIETLRMGLEKLPIAHQVALSVALEAKNQAAANQNAAQVERDQAAQALAASERARADFERCHLKRNEAEQKFSRAEKLAKAFGPGGLQAKIVAKAQHTIGILANETLDKLSQGAWQIDLRENPAGTELEIIARDLGRGGKERPFECLSGGERFRVAISLAIAIGQSACGGQAINTLVIDEGFGALDDLNRGLLVDELRRLSEQVLRGGRIIIVSHQDDVCSEFDFRYQLSRDSDGYAQVERFTP